MYLPPPQQHLDYLNQRKLDPAAEITSVDLDTAPFLRALLIADGTVTRLLEAYFSEKIQVTTTDQYQFKMPGALPTLKNVLKFDQGDPAFYRAVTLTGNISKQCYAHAYSLLNPALLKPGLFKALISDDVGMGEVLRNDAQGSFREVLDIEPFGNEAIRRTYAVFIKEQPAILITENFFLAPFKNSL